ncbi:MAG: hypothetical protein Q4E18_10185 [Clostridia bacterium]|nr:hypothetical protein [Clostridia bacterium]
MLKRLNGSWYLTDGILTPVRLDAPACVDGALRGAGILTDGESAADLLKNEWIYRREWRYSLSPEGGFPADGRAYLSLFGLRGEWTALLDGRELARGDDTEAEIALPAGEQGATLTIAFAVPAAMPLWPRVGLDGGCLLRTVGSAAITSLSLNVPDDAPWTARTAVRAEAAGACDLRYVLEIGGERTETSVRETLAPGENLFEHTIHEPARPAALADSSARAATESGRAAASAPGATSSERTTAGVGSSSRAAALSSGATSSERASSAASANSSARTMPETKTSTGKGFFARILHKESRPAATPPGAAPSARSAAETGRAAVLASGADFLERFSTGVDSSARGAATSDSETRTPTENGRAAAFAPGAASSERFSTDTNSSARGAANPDFATRPANPASSENFLERFSADVDFSDRAAANNGHAANPASSENFLERFSADADFAAAEDERAAFASGAASPERAAADAGFSARAATDNERAAAFASSATSSECAAANAGFSARVATDNGRAATFANGATSPERAAAGTGFSARATIENGRAAALANGADSAARAAVTVSLRAEILLDGVVSDARDARLCIPADETAPRGFAGADAVSAALAAEIGANALCAPDASRARMAAAEHELTFIPYHSLATQRAARACQRYEALLRLAGDESRVLDPALWRLTGCDMDAPELSSLLSSDGDFEEVCRRSRYRQAITLRDAAEHARMKRVPFLLDGAKDDAPTCLSGALFDLDGAARPAYFALADAWKAEHAFVLPPESFPADSIVSVPVFYLSDEKTPPCTVNVRAYSMDGQELITAGFPVPGRATDVIGRLCVEMPEDGLLLLRASVLRDGACVSRSDRLITLNEACLSALRPVQLLPDAAALRNASNTVAVGVSVPAAHYFGALLPGETLPLDEPRLTGFEALNPLL